MRRVTALALLLLAGAEPAGPGPAGPPAVTAIEAVDDTCRYRVEADAARFSPARLGELLRFWEASGENWTSAYFRAARSPFDSPLPDVARSLAETQRLVDRFDASVAWAAPPPELEPVVRWTRAQLVFFRALTAAEHAFCVSGDLALLRRPVDGIDPAARCAAQIGEVEAAGSDRCRRAAHRWGNCVNHAFHERNGEYPQGAWSAFVAGAGLRFVRLECDEP